MSTLHKPKKYKMNPSYCKFGAETLNTLVEALEGQIDGVSKSEDIECVHKMRVASRRIRAAVPLFRVCFPRKKFKNWLRETKKVTRLLGEARDLDVQIAFVQQYMKKMESPAERSVLNVLLTDRKDRRTVTQATVVYGLEELKDSDTLSEMEESCANIIKKLAKIPFESSSVLEKAHWYISSKLDDFLAMEEYVHQEDKILKHHEMRIRAKWLRYTMETFSPLFNSRLAEEITTIKAFQDVLGEMHDCDVWIDYIPKFIVQTNSDIRSKNKKAANEREQALLRFLAYTKETRKKLYTSFIQLWDGDIASNFFERLRETTNNEFTVGQGKTKQRLLNPDAKIAVMADIHANLHALKAVIQDAEKRGIHVFLNAGDIIGFGPLPNEVIEFLHSKNVMSVLGNYDLEVIKNDAEDKGIKRVALEFAKKELTKSCESYLLSLPREARLENDEKKLLMVHGSPESVEEHIYYDTEVERLRALADGAKADVVIVGHSHEQFIREVNGVSFINPGSVGRPGDDNPRAAYAIMSLVPFNVEFVRLDYDVTAAADSMRKKKMPEAFAQMLLRGVALDTIIEEDNVGEAAMVQDCEEMEKTSKRVSEKYWKDTRHCEQVGRVALRFFDGLDSLHHLGKRERCWLECAAILHDIGLSEGTSGHHKISMRLILNDTELPFASKERRIIASIVRYHRRNFPSANHFNLATFNRETVRKIAKLSSFLRVADGLDYSHQSVVKNVNFRAASKKVTVECTVHSSSIQEENAFNKKKNLFENVFKRKLILVWKQ